MLTQDQSGVTSLAAYLRSRLVRHRTYQESENQVARAGSVGVEWTDHDVAAVIREHGRVGTVVEEYLERVPTLLANAHDQHLVIMAQSLRVTGIARRCTEEE